MGNSAQTETANTSSQNSMTNANSAQTYGSNVAGTQAQNTANTTNYGSATGPSAAAAALIAKATDPSSTASNISTFMNPYTKQVLDAQMALENQQNAVQQNQLTGNAIAQGALGGNRAQDAAAVLAGQQTLANNATNSGILQSGFNTALQAAQGVTGQQLQGAGLSGTQTSGGQQAIGSQTGQTSQSMLGSQNTSQNSATAATGTGTGSSTTTQQPGLASNIGLGMGLLGMLADGGAVKGHADGGKATIGGTPAFDSGGAVAGQFVWVPGQNGAPGQHVWVPAQSSGQGQQQGQGAAGAGGFNSGVQQAQGIGEMYHLGQKARAGLHNLFDSMGSEGSSNKGAIAGLFGSSSAPTTGAGGWQTGTQTAGEIGSGGIGNTLSHLGSAFAPVQASMPSLPAAQASAPDVPTAIATPASMPSVVFPAAPTAHTSSGKGSGGAVRGFANGGDADFGDADADYTIGDAFQDGNRALLGKIGGEDAAGRDVAAGAYLNPLPAEALRGPVFRSEAKNLSESPIAAPSPQRAEVPSRSVAEENHAFLGNNKGFGLAEPSEPGALTPASRIVNFLDRQTGHPETYGPGNKTLADAPTAFQTKTEEAPASPQPSEAPTNALPENIPLPTRRPANLGETPVVQPAAPAQPAAPTLAQPVALTAPAAPATPPATGRRAVVNTVVSELKAAGMTENGIRGILANSKDESGFDPGLRHADQPRWSGEAHYAHGLYQEGAEEWNKYANWLQQTGHSVDQWRDPTLQTRFLAQNLQQNYPQVWKAMNEGTPEQAAQAFVSGYLKPAKQYELARAAQYGRGVPGIEDFVNGAVGEIKSGAQAIGHGIQSAGDAVSSNIGNIANRMRSLLGGGDDANPEQKKHDAGLFESAFGVSPFNLSDNTRNRLMQAATLLSSYGANNLQGGLEHIQDLDVKQKNLARQAQHDALNLKMELEKLSETKRYHEATEDRWTPFNVKGEDGKEQTIRVNQRTGEEVPMQYKSISSGTGRGAGAGSNGGVYEVKRQAYLAVHPGDNQGALAYASGHKAMSETEVQKAAAQLAQKDAATEGVMGQKYRPYVEERTKHWADALRQGVQASPQAAPAQQAAAPTQAPQQQQGSGPLDKARAAIAAGAPREKVIERLKQNGIDPSGL